MSATLFRIVRHAISSLVFLFILAPEMVMASEADKVAAIFKRVLSENMPGKNFAKPSYLALDEKYKEYKRYKGALSDATFRVEVNNAGVVTNLGIETKTARPICLHLRPIVDGAFGEYVKKSSASITGKSIAAGFGIAGLTPPKVKSKEWDYRQNNIKAYFECVEKTKNYKGQTRLPFAGLIVYTDD